MFFDIYKKSHIEIEDLAKGFESMFSSCIISQFTELKIMLSSRQIIQIFEYLDIDSNGVITYKEFSKLTEENFNQNQLKNSKHFIHLISVEHFQASFFF